jgi:secondary thiamine-phosphate synthase enzyme
LETLEVKTTQRNQWLDVTDLVRAAVRRSGVQKGYCIVYCPHTTAAVTVNENADPDVVHDIQLWMDQAVPHKVRGFRHAEGNSDAHIKTSLVGPSVMLIVEAGDLVLGRWQGVFFCEFDGPRTRSLNLQIAGD